MSVSSTSFITLRYFAEALYAFWNLTISSNQDWASAWVNPTAFSVNSSLP